jgi:hypothetical protein
MPARQREPINWLEVVDSASRWFPRARSWINYRYFFFTRYPQLQPADTADRKRQLHLEVGRETFQEELEKWEICITKDKNARQVLEGLSNELRAQLAALMIDCTADIGDYICRLPYHKRLRKATLGAARNERMLKRKLTTLHDKLHRLLAAQIKPTEIAPNEYIANRRIKACQLALTDLENYLEKLSPLIKPVHLFGKALDEFFSNSLPEPGSIKFPDLSGLLKTPGFHITLKDPVAPCMVKLYWFFRHGCEITGDHSEVRVALLRNTFWGKYKIPPVKYREKFDREVAEPAGCPAVIEAVRRYSARVRSA